MSGWKRGAIAMVSAANRSEPYPASYDGTTWRSLDGGFCVDQPTSHRPLVVIDPEDDAASEAVVKAFVASGVWKVIPASAESSHAYRREQVQAALRSLVTDPKPEEPQGLGAVVEGYAYTATLRTFVRCAYNKTAWMDEGGNGHDWSEIDVVRVLSAGWSE